MFVTPAGLRGSSLLAIRASDVDHAAIYDIEDTRIESATAVQAWPVDRPFIVVRGSADRRDEGFPRSW